ncbi:hypothetical protein HIM_09465 [Hirsutella minnesotensis 3608]|uniref:GS catalytic domain-containing protein n=1 Tax=Hirsutella minnesotensis 3608 TaxID=1043627 RepID=A0A0F7ZGL7_9HYPO|nr:hypothetical protein HIM_09465 [Hirsutella minnesotensis 3608]
MGSWAEVQARFEPEFVWLGYMGCNGTHAVRMFPVAEFAAMVERDEQPSVMAGVISASRNHRLAPGRAPSGVLYLKPDWNSAWAHASGAVRRVEMMASWVDKAGEPAPECARSKLGSLDRAIRQEHRLAVLLGFEVEVVLQPDGSQSEDATLSMIEATVRALMAVGVPVRQFHAELAGHQWEFALGPGPPVDAVDRLVRARKVISDIARAHGAQATLHPRPVATDLGTGAHVHISATPVGQHEVGVPEGFFAGILRHLRAVAAFTLPLDVSYQRVGPGLWSGGHYVCWGWENREVPLRRISTARFEFKPLCPTANPYVALAALLAAGLDGLRSRLTLEPWVDCQHDPATLSEAVRLELGIHQCLPKTIEESLEALAQDDGLRETMGQDLAAAHVAVTREWNSHLRAMDEDKRHKFLLRNY